MLAPERKRATKASGSSLMPRVLGEGRRSHIGLAFGGRVEIIDQQLDLVVTGVAELHRGHAHPAPGPPAGPTTGVKTAGSLAANYWISAHSGTRTMAQLISDRVKTHNAAPRGDS